MEKIFNVNMSEKTNRERLVETYKRGISDLWCDVKEYAYILLFPIALIYGAFQLAFYWIFNIDPYKKKPKKNIK